MLNRRFTSPRSPGHRLRFRLRRPTPPPGRVAACGTACAL